MIIGNLPQDLGLIDLNPTEMKFWMYCPIAVPGMNNYIIPDNLKEFEPLVFEALLNYNETVGRRTKCFVYITAKTLYVHGSSTGQRPGWHCDGFGTDDINYIWYDGNPTEFIETEPFEVSDDCDESMKQMDEHQAKCDLKFYPSKHLLRLDQTVVHRAAPLMMPGMRTFVKVSVSKHRYDLIGNSINHDLPQYGDEYHPRGEERNHPYRDFEKE